MGFMWQTIGEGQQCRLVVPYLRSIMHMHFYCYVTGGTTYLLDWESEWCYSDSPFCFLQVFWFCFGFEKM